MTRHSSLLTMVLLWLGLASPPTGAAGDLPRPGQDDWVSLFNGTDLEGWEGDRTVWRAERGCIVGRAARVPQNTFLISRRRFSDFVLRAEWKLTKAGTFPNSGIQFRAQVADPKKWTVSGYQLDLGEGHYGDLHEELGRSLIAAGSPEAQRSVKPGDWNQCQIIAIGPKVRLSMNGVVSVDWEERDPKRFVRDGVIALQYHHPGEGFEIRFRNIRILDLGDSGESKAVPGEGRGKVVDLLPVIVPGRDALSGTWSTRDGAIVSEGSHARLEIPITPPEEYDYRIVFSRADSQETVIQLFSHGGRSFAWAVGAFENTACAFLGGAAVRPLDNQKWLSAGRRHVSVVQVRKTSVKGFLDGNLISDAKYEGIGDKNWSTRDPKHLGLANNGTTSYFSVELTPVVVVPGRPAR